MKSKISAKKGLKWLTLLSVMLILGSCATSVTRLSEDPQAFAGKTVFLRGTVLRSVTIPFSEYYLVVLGNGDDRAPVFTRDKGVIDRKKTVRGKVIAFPEDEAQDAAEETVKSFARFLYEHGFVAEDEALKRARNILKGLRPVLQGLGKAYFIVEK